MCNILSCRWRDTSDKTWKHHHRQTQHLPASLSTCGDFQTGKKLKSHMFFFQWPNSNGTIKTDTSPSVSRKCSVETLNVALFFLIHENKQQMTAEVHRKLLDEGLEEKDINVVIYHQLYKLKYNLACSCMLIPLSSAPVIYCGVLKASTCCEGFLDKNIYRRSRTQETRWMESGCTGFTYFLVIAWKCCCCASCDDCDLVLRKQIGDLRLTFKSSIALFICSYHMKTVWSPSVLNIK